MERRGCEKASWYGQVRGVEARLVCSVEVLR
jgi:hypothetical protein